MSACASMNVTKLKTTPILLCHLSSTIKLFNNATNKKRNWLSFMPIKCQYCQIFRFIHFTPCGLMGQYSLPQLLAAFSSLFSCSSFISFKSYGMFRFNSIIKSSDFVIVNEFAVVNKTLMLWSTNWITCIVQHFLLSTTRNQNDKWHNVYMKKWRIKWVRPDNIENLTKKQQWNKSVSVYHAHSHEMTAMKLSAWAYESGLIHCLCDLYMSFFCCCCRFWCSW